MRPQDFGNLSTGTLEPTSFEEPGPDGQLRTAHGLAFVPNKLPPRFPDRVTLIGRLYPVLERVQGAMLRLDGQIDALPGRSVLLATTRVREARASSRIENTFASAREVALAGVDQPGATDESREVYRNRMAIEAGLRSRLPICNRLLKEMHAVLIVDRKDRPGQFRDKQVCVGDERLGFGEARFVPPPPARIEEWMADWERFGNPSGMEREDSERMPYWAELAIAHYQFEAIHPFRDGNGRLGRAMVTLAPTKHGVLRHPVSNLSEWVRTRRQEYYDRLLRVSTHGEWEDWIRFFCTALAEQAREDLALVERVAKLYKKYDEKLTTRRNSILVRRLLDHLFDRQAVTITRAATVLGVSYTAAQRHVEAFVKLGIVKPLAGVEYGRIYLAEGVIRAIQGQGEE
jgi:Fic family protein